MDLDEETYAVINANNAAAMRLEAHITVQPKELFMSLETVLEQRRKVDVICGRLRAREAALTREGAGEPNG